MEENNNVMQNGGGQIPAPQQAEPPKKKGKKSKAPKKRSIRGRVIRIVVSVSAIISTVSLIAGFFISSHFIHKGYWNNAYNVAAMISVSLNVDTVQKAIDDVMEIYESIPKRDRIDTMGDIDEMYDEYAPNFYDYYDTAEHEELYTQLYSYAYLLDLLYVYIVYVDEDTNAAIYIEETTGLDDYTEYDSGAFDLLTDEEVDFFLKNDLEGDYIPLIRNMEEDQVETYILPIYDEEGEEVIAFIGVDILVREIVNECLRLMGILFLVLVILTVIVCVVMIKIVEKKMVTPVKVLTQAAGSYKAQREQAGEDPTYVFCKLPVNTGDEIEQLRDTMQEMEQDLNSYISNLTKVTAEKEKISTELAVATKIQQDLLPTVFPPYPDRPEFDLYASMNPAKEVGGDFYDFFLIDSDHLGIVMADVSGKGVPAALFMMSSMIYIKNRSLMGGSPDEILTFVNDQVCATNTEGMFVTVWLGILEISTGHVIAANAGHEYPAIGRAGGKWELLKDKHDLVIGMMEDMDYHSYEFDMKPGDALYLYTDGVPESTRTDLELYGTDRMLEALNIAPDAAPERIIGNVIQSIADFVKNGEQFDDTTQLCIRYKGRN